MDTNALKKFAQSARRQLLAQVSARMEQVLTTDSAVLREKKQEVELLRANIEKSGKQAVIDEVAYTWFNRLCALRYMDVNNYTRAGIVSPTPGFTQPEILQQAKQGLFDPDWQLDRKRVSGLLDRSVPSPDADQEAYRLLLVAACNSYAREMDFLFTAIQDVTELLMPEDLLSNQSVLQAVRETLTPDVCQDVEVIGWLYQFYISERKDQVMAAKVAVKKEDIPAVTQLFTPDWIVRYMVQNSLGRLWLLNNPNSTIRSQMDYYIPPAEQETDFLKVSSPEELKVLDPACGSGHILTYAFDLLVAIYEEQGYDPVRIPRLILEKNLYGIEIDKRAAMLASFALMMKARSKDQRFFSRRVKPNILEMEDVRFDPGEGKAYLDRVGRDLYTQDLWEGLQQFENAKTFGSLIRPAIKDVPTLRERMQATGVFEDLFLSNTNEKLLKLLEMSEYLSPRYQVVVANPPYFGGSMDLEYKQFARDYYPESKSDTFAMFIERNVDLAKKEGFVSMVTMQNWMFLSSYESLRTRLLENETFLSMAHLGTNAFDTIGGAVVSTTMFTLQNTHQPGYLGDYLRLVDGDSESEKIATLREAIANPDCGWCFRVSAADFKKIPGSPIAYWVSDNMRRTFENKKMKDFSTLFQGMITGDNGRYLRYWFELGKNNLALHQKNISDVDLSRNYWIPYNKGGENRKWYGNQELVVNFSKRGKNFTRGKHQFSEYFLKPCFSWTYISSSYLATRYFPEGFLWDVHGSSVFPFDQDNIFFFLSLLSSKVGQCILKIINPTISFQVENIAAVPIVFPNNKSYDIIIEATKSNISIARKDWNLTELSWDYARLPLLKAVSLPGDELINHHYQIIRNAWREMTDDMQSLEKKINSFFIEAYDLEEEITPDVPLSEITLTCNPHYRYRGNYSENELENRLREDTIKEFLSYAVGCMFGRYSLDKPGLILANQGETLEDYLRIIDQQPTFSPAESNVIPILDDDWFADDIVSRFRQFLKITFGEPNYEDNLRFIEGALGKDLRSYFVRDFYKDHVQTYKKRPIYWLFSSPKGSFNALVYMHRYQPDTVSVVLNQYLREYREKLNAQRRYLDSVGTSQSSSAREKTAALNESESIARIQAELKTYEDDVLFPLAGQRITIDLDDGVLVNYAKFGDALKKL